jgi:catechol 2,3-dioxygenase-like lactoylglutathione lyase family enzyme
MTSWKKYVDVIILFTEDRERSTSFYRDVLGLAPDRHDNDFWFGETLIILLDSAVAADQIAPAVVASQEAGSALQMTIIVDNVDGVCADLARLGVQLINGPADQPHGQRAARFADPAGHIWEVKQNLAAAGHATASGDLGAWEKTEKRIERITLFVAHLDRARSFYQEVFGLPAETADLNSASFRVQNMSVTLVDIVDARDLIEPLPVADGEAGSRFHLTNFMDPDLCDVDTAAAELAGHGVPLLSGPADRPWGKRTALFADAGGCIWELVQNAATADRS